MFASDLIEVLAAAHLSSYVESPYQERGGIFVVGPPGVLKSTFLDQLDHYPDALCVTDLNAKSLVALRDRVTQGTIKTLVFGEYAKIYERRDETSHNLEGAIRALAAEGFTSAAFEPQGISRFRARAMIIGALTPAVHRRHAERWEETGFTRRFLWSSIYLSDPQILERAVIEWRRVDFQVTRLPQAPLYGEVIPNLTQRAERELVRNVIKHQPGGSNVQQIQILTKILAVLRWWYRRADIPTDPLEVVTRFAASLGAEAAPIELTEVTVSDRRTTLRAERKRRVHEAAVTLAAVGERKRKRGKR